jgi:hypothetical protein
MRCASRSDLEPELTTWQDDVPASQQSLR